MKNLTLRIDEKVLAKARKRAALKGTTVAKIVRDYVASFASDGEEPAEARKARLELAEMARASRADFGAEWKWRREEAYEGPRFSRLERIALCGKRKPGRARKASDRRRTD
jgi:Arc/MetJ family transcription regulator